MTLNLKEIEDRVDLPRDGRGAPLIVPPEGGKPIPLQRTTTFIGTIEDKTNLAMWGKRTVMVATAMFARAGDGIIDQILDLDPTDKEHKKQLNALAEVIMDKSGANDKRDRGTHLHKLSELVDEGVALPEGLPAADVLAMAVYALETADFEWQHIEQPVVVPELKVAGTPDRTCLYDGPGPDGKRITGNFIFDLKTGTLEYSALKFATQLACYSRGKLYHHGVFAAPPYAKQVKKGEDGWEAWKAWEAWRKTEFDAELAASAYSDLDDVNQDWGIILSLPSDGTEPGLHWANLEVGWEAAQVAATIRDARKMKGDALIPFGAVAA